MAKTHACKKALYKRGQGQVVVQIRRLRWMVLWWIKMKNDEKNKALEVRHRAN